MNHFIDLQNAQDKPLLFSEERIIGWAKIALNELTSPSELTLRFVDTQEIHELNKTYRKQDKPTNVLAFPGDLPDEVMLDCTFLGDIIICPQVLEQESKELNISEEAHWAHIIIHGVLHLLGYDHIEAQDTELMQSTETRLLATLGIANPYLEDFKSE